MNKALSQKKGDLPLQYIFLIFISTIAVFVIVGMITNWSFNANKYISRLFGSEENALIDNELINITDCSRITSELVKHAKLCQSKAGQGMVKGAICYGIVWSDKCAPILEADVRAGLGSEVGIRSMPPQLEKKTMISYDYESGNVSFI